MTPKIDQAGRIVVPKPMRERLGLLPGADLEVMENAGAITLRLASDRPAMVHENGFWVHQGVAPKAFDWNAHLHQQREERSRQAAGV